MALPAGTYTLGPQDGTLLVRTGRTGAAAKAGHDLVIEVTSWHARLDVGDGTAIALDADARSLRVRHGSGGVQSLDDDDKAGIERTIDDEVLRGGGIAFRSTSVESAGGCMKVHGELELAGTRRPISFELACDDGRLSGSATITQSAWGMKPYSTLFGTLKVADDVEIVVDCRLPESGGATTTRSDDGG
jgi:YceI-like protein